MTVGVKSISAIFILGTFTALAAATADNLARLAVPTIARPTNHNETSNAINKPLQTLNDLNLVIQCYVNPAVPTRPNFRPISTSNYMIIIQQILVQPFAMIPRTWDLGPKGVTRFSSGSAYVELETPWPPSPEVLAPIYVARGAALIAENCTGKDGVLFGGQTYLPGGFRVVLISPITRFPTPT